LAHGFQVDWVLVHVRTVRRIGAVVALLLLATALLILGYNHVNPSPERRAGRAIDEAEHARRQVMAAGLPDSRQGEVRQADGELAAARGAFSERRYPDAESLARGATDRFASLLGTRAGESDGVGHFFTIEGRIQVQRAGSAQWENAQQRMAVFNGDFVKSGRDGTAEILFIDGSLYRMEPNSLLEIHHQRKADTAPGAVRMVVGRINVYTADAPSKVTTDTTETEIQRESSVALDVAEDDKGTRIAAYKGSARVRGRDGKEVVVSERELVAATADGSLSGTRRIPDPPLLMEPANNASFELAKDHVIHLQWRRRSPRARVHLQVSRSQRFGEETRDIDADGLRSDSARLQAITAGTYFWRLATVEPDDVRSEWSAVRRFRIFASDRQSLLEDHTPPELEINPPQQLGRLFIVRGHTEPGAAVTINGEFVEVDGEGRFDKTVELTEDGWNDIVFAAVDPSGNRTERRERVFVEGVY